MEGFVTILCPYYIIKSEQTYVITDILFYPILFKILCLNIHLVDSMIVWFYD